MADFPASTIALFPLGAALFPGARMPLQIFEPRYLDLVTSCMKRQSGFGVILIRQGSEVYRRGENVLPQLATVGCYARIVDWDALPQNHLGITIEGGERFSPGPVSVAADHLLSSHVSWWEPEPVCEVPPDMSELIQILRDLQRHPLVAKLRFQIDENDAFRVGCQLAQLLPIREQDKLELLQLRDSLARLHSIEKLLQIFR